MIYNGDFQNARQLLQAITRRIDRKPVKPADTLLQAFHQKRARQIGRTNIANKVLIVLHEGRCNLRRAPDLEEAVEDALGQSAPARLVISLRELLGMVGAHEWRRKGVYVDALQARVHAHYGVYSPVRGEYTDLIRDAQLNNPPVAWDIGTGTGIIAAILVGRGVDRVVATDTSPQALECAAENIARLNLGNRIQLVETNLFPDGAADLIVCNPPWLPAKATTPLERAVYDPGSQMLKGFLNGTRARLNVNGEAWLVMSNLAENIGLRNSGALREWISQAHLQVVEKRDTVPTHARSHDRSDPLYKARSQEVTSLYRLTAS